MRTRETWIEVDLSRLNKNIETILAHTKKSLFAVVKANAYGHGDIAISKQCIASGVEYLCVSSLDEALHIRKHHVPSPILVMGYVSPDWLDVALSSNITISIISFEWLEKSLETLAKYPQAKVHIKIDTGMNRLGIKSEEEFLQVLDLLRSIQCQPEGIYTHFLESSNTNKDTNQKQSSMFRHYLSLAKQPFRYIHTSNTDATFAFEEDYTNAVRCGLAMYGYSSVPSNVLPILSLYTKISQKKWLVKGESVSYGARYVSEKNHATATLPIGYADGISRHLSGLPVYIQGKKSCILGTICMDQLIITLDGIDANVGDVVEIIGPHQSVRSLSDWTQTIHYEILTGLSDRITRYYLEEGKVVQQVNLRYES